MHEATELKSKHPIMLGAMRNYSINPDKDIDLCVVQVYGGSKKYDPICHVVFT